MYLDLDVKIKSNIIKGLIVDIVEEKNKQSQEVTRGYVKRLISNSDQKNKGIKVELTNGAVGRVVGIPSKNDIQKENFKFYNVFFYQDIIYGIWDKKNKQFFVIKRQNKLTGRIEKTMLLFSDLDIANAKIKGTPFEDRNFQIKSIKRKSKLITNVFKNYDIDVFSINTERKVSIKKMKDLEEKFKSF